MLDADLFVLSEGDLRDKCCVSLRADHLFRRVLISRCFDLRHDTAATHRRLPDPQGSAERRVVHDCGVILQRVADLIAVPVGDAVVVPAQEILLEQAKPLVLNRWAFNTRRFTRIGDRSDLPVLNSQ